MLSHRRGAIAAILLGLAAVLSSFFFGTEWPPVAQACFRRGGNALTFLALTWVVAHAVYAPGRITSRRLQGAAVVYLNLATIFAAVFSLIWDLNPSAFANVPAPIGGPGELATMLYFSLTTLTTAGLRRHCAGRSVGPQHGQPRVHHRAVLPRHYSRPPGDARTRTPAARLKAHSPDLRLKALPPMPV